MQRAENKKARPIPLCNSHSIVYLVHNKNSLKKAHPISLCEQTCYEGNNFVTFSSWLSIENQELTKFTKFKELDSPLKSIRFIERVEKPQEAVGASVTNDSVSYIQSNQSSLTHQIKVKIKRAFSQKNSGF